MKRKILCILVVGCLLLCGGCREPGPPQVNLSATEPSITAVEPTAGTTETTTAAPEPKKTQATEAATTPTEPQATEPTKVPTQPTDPTEPSKPEQTIPKPTEPSPTKPTPPETVPPEPPTEETVPPTTEPEQTQPTEAEPYVPTAEFKQEVAYYAAYYINQYRAEAGVPACTILPGMTLVAEYRADQLCYNYSHSTADKREALAYYQYGRWVDATIVGLPASDSYYEADTAEAICAGFKGTDAESMGKYIANMIRKSSSHWSYVGSADYSYIAVGVEYREDSQYRWYGCVMVGTVDYG